MNTLPLFTSSSSMSSTIDTASISPTKPLDLRSSISKAQQKFPNQSRLSIIAQRLANDRKEQLSRDSFLSTATSESTTSFATALSEQGSSQNGSGPGNIHSFRALANRAQCSKDPDMTPVVASTSKFDQITPKAIFAESPRQYQPSTPENSVEYDIRTSSNGTIIHNDDYNAKTESITSTQTKDENEKAYDISKEYSYDDMIHATDNHMMTTTTTQNQNRSRTKDNIMDKSIRGPQEENLAFLFIIAVHPFNVSSLENKEDIAICLSFEKNDVAFVHTVDESGWGEVTLLKNLSRGWVPFNYFSDVVKTENSGAAGSLQALIETRKPLEKLLSASAKFLLYPQGPKEDEPTFDINKVNNIREGVKALLQDTDCISRSNTIVEQRPIIRKMRKRLLAEWYNLMIKADSYKNSVDVKRIDILATMTYAVLRKAFLFYEIWSVEKLSHELATKNRSELPQLLKDSPNNDHQQNKPTLRVSTQKLLPKSESNIKSVSVLKQPPKAVERLREIHELLFTYFAILVGRMDLIEHNPVSCELLESIVHQIILLLRELLYISQACSTIIQTKYHNKYENNLDHNLDPLLSLVSELVSCVKIFVTHTINEKFDDSNELLIKDDIYYYTDEGEHMVVIISRMTTLVANAISGCNNYLKIIGDFKLSWERSYPDFNRIKITPDQFVKKCSSNLLKKLGQYKRLRSLVNGNGSSMVGSRSVSKSLARYSTIRSGRENHTLSMSGTQFLVDSLPDNDSFTSKFEFFKPEVEQNDLEDRINDRESMKEELQLDKSGNIIGSSFRSLVFMLTDELGCKDNFLLSTFLLNYKSFGSSNDLIECLIKRFDVNDTSQKYSMGENNGTYSSVASRMRNRRRLVCKLFQTWMESYWDFQNDYQLVATLMNFFIEEVSRKMPIEAKVLIATVARLAEFTPRAIRESSKEISQLVPPLISKPTRNTSFCSIASSTSSSITESTISTSIDEQFIERYELTKLPQTSHSTISLPIPILGLGSSSLLTRRNFSDLERLVIGYRKMVSYKTVSTEFTPCNLHDLLEKWLKLVKNSPRNSYPDDFIHNDLNLCDLNPLEVSKQLSLIESTIYLGITPSDLLHGKNSLNNPSVDNSANITTIILFTNLLSNYVFESILTKGLSLKKRISRVNTWLRIALSALYFRNFNALASIMTALQSYVISRLSLIWDSLSDNDIDLYEYLSKIIHPNGNYKVYRQKLNKIKDETSFGGESNSTNSFLPVVPFFNLFLQDLAFIDEGNPTFRNPDSFRPNKLINIDKFLKMTNTIATFQYFQVGYDQNSKPIGSRKRESFFSLSSSIDVDSKAIKPVPELQEFILFEFWRVNTMYVNDSDRAYQLSLKILPKN